VSEPVSTSRSAVTAGNGGRALDAERDALTLGLAARHCNRNGVECGWYHGEWELLKCLGIVSTAAVHTGQLQVLLQLALDVLPQRPRILLSGCTDDALLRVVQAGAAARVVDVVALDLCATPLELARARAASLGIAYDAVRADILEHEDREGFDLILTHAFMGNFPEADRARLVAKWFALLRPGGCLATIQRIRPPGTPAVIGFSGTQAEAFVQSALASATRIGLRDLPRVERAARAFTQHKRTHAITSRTGFERLFTGAGFEFLHLVYEALPTRPGLSGPSVPSGGEYAMLLAGRA